MVVLKRILASTLMETLVATVLIVIIFMISSMLLNNMFANSIKARSNDITEQLQVLKYEYTRANLQLPYYEQVEDWEYSITDQVIEGINLIVFKAENESTKSTITQILINEN